MEPANTWQEHKARILQAAHETRGMTDSQDNLNRQISKIAEHYHIDLPSTLIVLGEAFLLSPETLLAATFRKRREEMKLSRKALAKKMCVSPASVKHWETAETRVPPAMARLFDYVEQEHRNRTK